MKGNITAKTLLAFLGLLFVCHELHELIHTSVAYFQCGCWGQRDFNVWSICTTCSSNVNTVWATAVGPVFTYALIWIGWWLMDANHSLTKRSIGFALVWANVPFARLITVLMKGGDEGVVTRYITSQSQLTTLAWMVELGIVLLLVIPAFIRAWKLLAVRRRLAVFIAFLFAPMLLEFILMHKLGGTLLQQGVLDEQGMLGSPVLVLIWNAIWLTVLLLTARSLGVLLTQEIRIGAIRKEESVNV
ncbi:MAG TPA: hypothetical protein VEY32_03020 [Flavisolibacter sp.]|nr:hypothetical protein [Flavisolibacter sp.]